MKFILRFAIILCFLQVYSQDFIPTKNTEISIITIGPGDSLNDSFGHNAFRVKTSFSDVVYDYGRFDFDAPNFYLNFAQGKLNYFMGSAPYKKFKDFYVWQDRSIKEQVLNITEIEKKQLLTFLKHNLKPENKYYLYDFFFDNCATKMRDVTQKTMTSTIVYGETEVYKEETFRQLIQQNLHWNSWGSLGIDVALGSVIDQRSSAYDYMFLPENIYNFFEVATFKNSGKKLIKSSRIIHDVKKKIKGNNFFLSPFFILSLIALFIVFITYKNYKNKTQSKWLDIIILSITGLIGIVVLLLWVATDHSATAQNYNLLWAFPLSFLALFQVTKTTPKKWFIAYLKFLLLMLCLMILHWTIGIQRFAPTLIPILMALAIRYVFLIWFFKKEKA